MIGRDTLVRAPGYKYSFGMYTSHYVRTRRMRQCDVNNEGRRRGTDTVWGEEKTRARRDGRHTDDGVCKTTRVRDTRQPAGDSVFTGRGIGSGWLSASLLAPSSGALAISKICFGR